MACKQDFDRAQMAVSYSNCFWGSDAMMYGECFANRSVKEAEENLRNVAAACIAEGITGFTPVVNH